MEYTHQLEGKRPLIPKPDFPHIAVQPTANAGLPHQTSRVKRTTTQPRCVKVCSSAARRMFLHQRIVVAEWNLCSFDPRPSGGHPGLLPTTHFHVIFHGDGGWLPTRVVVVRIITLSRQ